jgi:hypothetical protein
MGRMVLMSVIVIGAAAACGGAAGSSLDGDAGPDTGNHSHSDSGNPMGSETGTPPPTDSGTDTGTPTDSGGHHKKDAEADTGKADTGPVDAGCPSFCASHTPTDGTCNDFDESSTIPSALKVTTSNGGTVAVSMAEAFSCANSLSSSLPMETGSSVGGSDAYAAIPFTLGTGTVTLDLEVYLPNDMTSYVLFFGLAVGNSNALGLEHHGDTDWFLSNGPSLTINQGLTTPPLVGAWNHMTLTVLYSETAGTASLAYEGNDHTPHTVMYSGPTLFSTATPTMGQAIVGMAASAMTEAPFTAYYDNVVVTVAK